MIDLNNIRNGWAFSRLLGMPTAARLHLMRVLPSKNREAVTQVKVPGLANGIWVRPHGSDMKVVLQTFAERDYGLGWCEPYRAHMLALCKSIREAGDVPLIIDAGANVGASTMLFASAFPDCHIYAIEPDANNFATLEANVGDKPNITLFHAGLWSKPTNLAMEHDGDTGWACRVQEHSVGKATMLPSVTLPELLAKNPRMRPVIVKIDIEGAEVEVLKENTGWVNDIPLMVFEAHDNLWHWLGPWQGSGHSFFSCLARRKREYLSKGENVYAFLHPDEMQPLCKPKVTLQTAATCPLEAVPTATLS